MDLENRVKNAFELIEAEQWEKADEAYRNDPHHFIGKL